MDSELQNLWTEGLKGEKRLEIIAAISKLGEVPVPHSLRANISAAIDSKPAKRRLFDFAPILVPAVAAFAIFIVLPRGASNNSSSVLNSSAIDQSIFEDLDSEQVVSSLHMRIFDSDFPEELL